MITTAGYWLLAAAVALAFEAFGVSGVGFLFAGLAAITTGIIIQTGIIAEAAWLLQFAVFFIASVGWAALLWKPMQRFRSTKGKGYQNMVGDSVVIQPPGLVKGRVGQAQWSGTIMRAELADTAPVDQLIAGESAVIAGVHGNTLLLEPSP